MRKYIFLIAAMWLPFITFAQNRSESSAISIAQEFWGNKVSRAKLKAVSQKNVTQAKARVAKVAPASGVSKQSFYIPSS